MTIPRILASRAAAQTTMHRSRKHRLTMLGLAIFTFLTCGIVQAQTSPAVTGNPPETPEATRGSQQNPTPVEAGAQAAEAAEAPPTTSLSIGGDFYLGRSNLEGFRRLRDGFWAAGSGPAYPSIVDMHLTTRSGAEAKVSIGIGNMYTADESTLDQPHEAWYRTPTHGVNLTVGKYYVPFALQEWQYETKWGAMLEGEHNATTWAASVNYNQNLNSTNAYLRVGQNFGEKLNVGVSLGAGRGLSYDTLFNKAVGLDATAKWKAWNFYSEYMAMRRQSSERFSFGFAKLEYEKLGKFKPFIAHWYWRDTTGSFGNLRSNGVGASYSIRPDLAVEGGFANTSDQNVKWIQVHWSPDWKIWSKGKSGSPSTQGPGASGLPPQLLPHSAP